MIADYCDGGQKMLDIMEFNKSLKIAWILKFIIQQIVTMPIYGKEALNICHPT